MSIEIIADEKGAILYNTTSNEAYSPVINHPEHPRDERMNRETAILVRAIYRITKGDKTKYHLENERETASNLMRQKDETTYSLATIVSDMDTKEEIEDYLDEES